MADSKFSQGAVQVQTQQQSLSPQQVMTARLTELPLEGLRERINKELEDNQWLEKREGSGEETAAADTALQGDSSTQTTREDQFGEADDDYIPRAMNGGGERTQRELGDTRQTFFDHLMAQLPEYDLDERQSDAVRYLIGNLEGDGLLRESLHDLAAELDIYQNVQVTEKELERLLTDVVQQMEPAGVGARNLRECLTLQARRNTKGERRKRLLTLFGEHWDDFSHLRWKKIKVAMGLDGEQIGDLQRSVRRLTPRPGGSVGNEPHASDATVTPDFVVTLDEEGQLHLSLNEGDLPQLTLSPDAEVALNMPTVTKADQEAVRYLRGQIDSAQLFIDSLAQRRRSMLLTMQAIVKTQRPFFLTGDEARLKPMKLEDVSKLTGLDISTVSRVSNSKYVLTPHGTFSLRWFFSGATTQDGNEVSVRSVQAALRALVDGEDKRAPLSDEKLVALLKQQGFKVARRTVAKYRTKLGIPESRLR